MKVNKTIKITGKILLWILGIWTGLMLLIQIVLIPPFCTRIANNVAGDISDASITIGRASVSIFRHFPRITFTVNDIDVTYPHERYDSIAKASLQGHLLYSGCGETVDTLASLKRASASISLLSLLSGDIKLPHIEVESPKVFAHSYDPDHANWNIFGSAEEPADTTTTETSDEEGMNIILRKLDITGRPRIVYTDGQDSLFALITLNSLTFDGDLQTNDILRTSADFEMDRLFVAGRYGTDTLALGLEKLKTIDEDDYMHMQMEATTFLATKAFGRMAVPVQLSADVSLPEDQGIAVSLHNIATDLATIPISGNIDVKLREDKLFMDGQIDISKFRIQKILHEYLAKFIPELTDVQTNTELSASATFNGCMDSQSGTMPDVKVDLDIPYSELSYSTFPEKIHLGMNAAFNMDTTGTMNAQVSKARLHTYGLGLDASFGIDDITGKDPLMQIDGKMKASLDSLRHFLPDTLNLVAEGDIRAELAGTVKMSELDIYTFSNASLDGHIGSSDIILQMPDDSIDVQMHGLDIILKPEYIQSRRDPALKYRLMGVTGKLISADIEYGNALNFKGSNIEVGAKNSSDNGDADPQNISYLGGHLNAELLQINDSEGTSIKLDNTKNRFQMRPKRDQPKVPVLSLTNKNQRITYITSENRIILTDSKISAKAAMNTFDAPRDSMRRRPRTRTFSGTMPAWMTENDFRSSDIKVDLNETVKKYFREWEVQGDAGIRTGIIMTPYLPLRNILRGAYMSFNNNRIAIDSLKVLVGNSELYADGSINGLRRIMLGRGAIQMDLNISSASINADELLKAYTIGSKFEAGTTGTSSEISNSEFFKQVTADTTLTTEQTSAPSLFVIPGNLFAKINLDASGIKYKDLDISSFTAGMLIKERCAQLTGTSMRSNMGGFDLDAFYATKSKKDIRTGFCLDIKNVTSERVIALMPELGEVIPMIGSIQGRLNCEIAATAALDTTMNIIMPSVNGIARLSGKSLSISDDEVFTSVAKTLLFKNKKKGEIDQLVIEGSIKDNCLEVFPFILKVDRYTLGLSGLQNMDMSYKHHISVLRSPLLLRLGLNISGPDYDHMKFRLGKAQYRAKSVPSFSKAIDQTKEELKASIYNIFDRGIDNTIDKRDIQTLIRQHQSSIGYTNAAEVEIEELSAEDMEKLEKSEASDSMMEEAMAAAVAAVQEVLKNK